MSSLPLDLRSYWALCLLLWLAVPAASQELDIKIHPNYTLDTYDLGKDQGLRGNLPYGFFQDRKGYIWLVANEWVQRYNGEKFETFFKIPDYREGSTQLIEDYNGRIWVFRYQKFLLSKGNPLNGLDLWVIDPETRTSVDAGIIWEKNKFDFPISQISAIGYSGTGSERRILFGTTDGRIVSIGPSVNTISKIPEKTPISILAGNRKGDVALAWKNSLSIIDSTGRDAATRQWKHPIAEVSLGAERQLYITLLEHEEIIQMGFLALFNKQQGWQIKSYEELEVKLDPKEVWHLENDSFLVNRSKVRLKNEKYPIFECLKCSKLFLDQQNNIWAPNSNGITVARVQPKKFKTLLNGGKIETRGILPVSDTSLLVHSYRGTYLVDLQDRILAHNPDMNAMIGINKDQQGRVWEAAHGWYTGFIPDYQSQLTQIKIWDSTLANESNYALFPLPDVHGLWLGTQWGLCYCSWNNSTVLSTCAKVVHPTLEKLTVNYLERSDTALWAATSAGLFLVNPDRQQVITYFDQLKDLDINHFARQDSTFWFSTYYNGLIRWELGAPNYQQVTLSKEEDLFGIPSLCAVYDDGLGYLWMPSISGLYRLRKADLAYQRFDRTHNIANEEFNYFSHARLPGNRFAFGGLDGITLVDPQLLERLDRYRIQIPLAISKVMLDNGKTTKRISLEADQEIALQGQRDILKMNCHLLDFRNALPGQIIYRLVGLDKDWHLLEGETLRLERLPFGKFSLEIRAVASDNISWTGAWDVIIISREPWYRTNLALVGLLLLVFGIGSGIVALRYRSVRKTKIRLESIVRERTAELEANRNRILQQNEELISLNNYKTKIMAIMGHDLRGPILGLSNLGKKMKYVLDQGDPQRVFAICSESERQIDNLRMLIDNLLVWSLLQDDNYLNSVKTGTKLWEVAEAQINLLQANAGNKKVSLKLSGDPEIQYQADQFVLGILIRNLIANSIRYSPSGGIVSVKVSTLDTKPVMIIEDQGPGMSAELCQTLNSGRPLINSYQLDSQEGLGLGLWICNGLLPKLQCQWSFSSAVSGTGLLVRLKFLG